MIEIFQTWIKLKFQIHNNGQRPLFYQERDVWWANFGQNVGDETNGKGDKFMRPVVVIRKFNKSICLVVPLSSVLKENPFYYPIEFNNRKNSVLISHLRTVDTRRFVKKMARLTPQDFKKINDEILKMIFRKK